MSYKLISTSFLVMIFVFSVSAQNVKKYSDKTILPVKNFDGVNNFTNSYQPPDIHGAVGLNQVMGISNLQFEIFDKNGNVLSGPTSYTTFFSPLASYGTPARDGRLQYDPFGKRWVFIVLYTPSKGKAKGFFMAISETDDPAGSWNLWAIPVNVLIDYPTLGFNKNWICVDNNRGSQLYVFDKQYMYNNSSVNAPSYKTINNVSGVWQSCVTLDSAESNLYLVKNTEGRKGQLSVGKITGTGSAPTYISLPDIFTGYTWNSPGSIMYPQLGSNNTLHSNGQDEMMNAIFLNHAIWCTQSVGYFDPSRVGFQWWELDPEQSSVLQFERIQDSTGKYFYCCPSIAVDYQNNVLVGFSIFSKTCYISSGYLTHLASENAYVHDSTHFYMNGLGTFLKKGWGDYSNCMMDPADHSLWTVQPYANNNHDWTTRWANIDFNTGTEKLLILPGQLDVEIYPNPAQDKLTINLGNHEDEYTVNVLNSKGESIGEWLVSSGETITELNTTSLPAGIYFLRVKSKSRSTTLKFEVNR